MSLGDIASVFNGNSIPVKEKKENYLGLDSGTPYIGTKDVSFTHEVNYMNGVLIPKSKTPRFRVAPKNCVLVCAEGGSAGRKVAHNSQITHFGNKLYAIVPNELANSKFLFYYCISNNFFQEFNSHMHGIIGGVSLKKFRTIQVPLPPLSEQKRIVEILDEAFAAIDKAISNTEKNIKNAQELLENKLSAILQKHRKYAGKLLKEISVDFGRGRSRHRPRNAKHLYGGKYPFVQTGDIRKSKHEIVEYFQTYSELGLAQSKLWPSGTVCITIAANIAETGILTFDACFPDSIIGIVTNSCLMNNHYLEYMLQAYKVLIQSKGKGSAQDNINLRTFEDLLFPTPPMIIQQEIVSSLRSLEFSLRSLRQQQIHKQNLLSDLKQSILHKVFIGELTYNFKAVDKALSEAGV